MTSGPVAQTCFLGLSPWAFGPLKLMKMTFWTCIFDPAAFGLATFGLAYARKAREINGSSRLWRAFPYDPKSRGPEKQVRLPVVHASCGGGGTESDAVTTCAEAELRPTPGEVSPHARGWRCRPLARNQRSFRSDFDKR